MAQDPIPWPDEEVTGPPIQSTADLIMRRAAQNGEFEQYEGPAGDENDEAGQREGQGQRSGEDAREEAEQKNEPMDEQIEGRSSNLRQVSVTPTTDSFQGTVVEEKGKICFF